MTAPNHPKRANTDHLFIGGGSNNHEEEVAPPTPSAPPARAKTPSGRQVIRPPSGHPPVAGHSSSRRISLHGDDPGAPRNDSARMITIIAIVVGALGLIALVMLLSGGRTVSVPTKQAPVAVAPTPTPTPTPEPVAVTPLTPTPLRDKPTVVPPSTSKTNMLPNPSVEELVDGKPPNWERMTYQGTADLSISDQARRGKNCLAISSKSGGDAGWVLTMTVKPRTSYLFKGWIRSENITGSGKGALFNLHPTEIQSNAVTGTTTWKQLSFQFETSDQTQVHINCLFGGWGHSTGTAWYDDFELIELFSSK